MSDQIRPALGSEVSPDAGQVGAGGVMHVRSQRAMLVTRHGEERDARAQMLIAGRQVVVIGGVGDREARQRRLAAATIGAGSSTHG